MKGEFFPRGSETQKMMNFEHVIVKRVASLFFFQLHFNKPYLVGVTKIVEITYAIYQGLCRDFGDDCARNMSEEKSTTRQSLICSEILPLHVRPHSPPE